MGSGGFEGGCLRSATSNAIFSKGETIFAFVKKFY